MSKITKPGLIQRYTASQRINHWVIAITFVLLAISGLALFHPAFYWMANLLGGGVWTRILHPFIGVLMFVCFTVFAARMFCHNLLTKQDMVWLKHVGDVINDRTDNLPESGRYNAGQKLLFFVLIIAMIGLLVTGVVMWRSYFAFMFPIWAVRLASLLHAVFALILICSIIVHIYAAIWVKGAVRAMTRGTVTPGWVYKHHRGWLRQLRGSGTHK